MPQFDADRESVLSEAIQSGIHKILLPGLDYDSSLNNINLCAVSPEVLYAAVGVHPNSYIERQISDEFRLISTLTNNTCIKAIGEIGLDFYRDSVPPKEQRERLIYQLDIAVKANLPVILHQRQSSVEMIEILETSFINQHKKRFKGVFHAFNGERNIQEFAIAHSFMLGIGGAITYNSSKSWLNIFTEIPLSMLLLETDSPFLAPQNVRGTRNIPQNTLVVASKLAEIYTVTVDTIIDTTWENSNRLFQWV